jgi:hypothetical protein
MKIESPYGKKRKKERVNVIDAAGQPPFTSKVSLVFCHLKKNVKYMDQVTKFACFLLVSRCKLYLSISLSLLQTTTTTVLSQLQSVSNFELLTKRKGKTLTLIVV